MQIYHSISEWRQVRKKMPSHLSIGFIPTMGNLHDGHMSLVAASTSENDCTVVSIFVNKAQFNHKQDYTSYPRTLDADLELLKKANVDCCIIPNDHEVYPDGYDFQINPNRPSEDMEGKFRPGHFPGVLTVVMKLFNFIKPHRAYFGEKDYEQLQLVREMVKSFFLDVEIRPCPTIRLASGLPFSSRNTRLNAEELILANKFAAIFKKSQTCSEIIDKLSELGIKIDYIKEHNQRRFGAVWVGDVRLIDNIALLK